MKLTEIFAGDKPTLSFEVFPPKTSDKYSSVEQATAEIARLNPSYMSVTYGAGGTNAGFAVAIASNLHNNCGVNALAHLTCIGATRENIRERLDELKAAGIENILALRGDLPQGMTDTGGEFRHASDLVAQIKEYGDFCVGGACYPEIHPESSGIRDDIRHLKTKIDAGCDFLTTQMFFDNNIFYTFLLRLREAGITVPVIPGIMPVTNAKSIKRITALSGNLLPQNFRAIAERFGDSPEQMKQAGIAYAAAQVIDLWANGVNAVHIYSMNKPDIAAELKMRLSEMLK